MPATADQIAKFRRLSGDTNTAEPDLTDEQISDHYDSAVTNASDSTLVEALTIVYILRERMGIAVSKVNQSGEFGTSRHLEVFNRIKDHLLPYWEGQAGVNAAPEITSGALNLTVDEPEDETT